MKKKFLELVKAIRRRQEEAEQRGKKGKEEGFSEGEKLLLEMKFGKK